MDNKDIFASNLKYYMEAHGKSRKEVSDAIGVSYFTFSDWVNGKKYARMDKIEKLADYFGILKSDLIEVRTKDREEMQKKGAVIATVAMRMKTDSEFLSLVESLCTLDADQVKSVKQLLAAFLK